MSSTTEQICSEALSLPHAARVEIAHRLLVSLESEDFSDEAGEAWRETIMRRQQEFRDGNANPVAAEEALCQAQAAIA